MPKIKLTHLILTLLIIGYATFFSAQAYFQYYSLMSRAMDLGNFDQALWYMVNGQPFEQTNRPGVTNRLSIHVEPILLPISLLYLIHQSPVSLFILQNTVIALAAVPIYALARRTLDSESLALTFALAYLMLPTMQGAALLDFHPAALAPTFLLSAFYFLETGRYRWFALFAFLSAMCKEDIALLVVMLGAYVVIRSAIALAIAGKWQQLKQLHSNAQNHADRDILTRLQLGLATTFLAAVWTFLAVFVIPRTFAESENIHWDRYGHLGDGAVNILLNFVLQPHRVLTHLHDIHVFDYLYQLLSPTAFTALLNPLTWLLAAPSLGINLLSNFEPMQQVNSLVYAAPIVPALFISSIYGVANLLWLFGTLSVDDAIASAETDFDTLSRRKTYSWSFVSSFVSLRGLLALLILTTTLINHFEYGYLPTGGQYRGWMEITPHDRLARDLIATIPPNASVSAQDRLNPHVTQRETVYIFDEVNDADYILLDVTEDSWPLHPLELRYRVDDFLRGEFGVFAAEDGLLILSREQPDLPKTLPDSFYDFVRRPVDYQPEQTATVTFDDKLQLLGYDVTIGAHQYKLPIVTLYWRALEPLEEDYRLWPFIINRAGTLIEDTTMRPLVTTIWYPTSRWSVEEIIATPMLPVDLAPTIGDQFTIAVGVTRDEWQTQANRLPITDLDESLYQFEGETWARLGTMQRVGRAAYELVDLTPSLSPDDKKGQTQTPPPTGRGLGGGQAQTQFWNIINLTDSRLPDDALRAGESLPLTLRWHIDSPITVDLRLFAHLLDEQGNLVAQRDWTPQDEWGYLPTSAWQVGRSVTTAQTIPLPPELSAGQYRLVVGWYYPVTGQRLPLTNPPDGGDSLELGLVTVE